MEIKDAVRNAEAFAIDSLGQDRTINIRLEEIESSTVDDRPVWLITLSIPFVTGNGPASAMRAIAASLGADTEREYKVFTVAKDTGEILSMKIRLLAAPTQ